MDNSYLDVPVVLIIFKRPATTKAVLDQIARVRPRQLFIVGDGPHPDSPEEAQRVEEARALLQRVDWNCDLKTNFSEKNLGLKRRIVSGLNWVFEQVDHLIVLEDDCVPDPSFFSYCRELLEKYDNEPRIMSIGGVNYQFGRNQTPYSYYFSIFNHVSGWASWRRAWASFDPKMSLWPYVRDQGMLDSYFSRRRDVRYWAKRMQAAYDEKIDAWDYCWTFACWANSGLTALPAVNLINNIGSGLDASYSHGRRNPRLHIPAQEMSFPLSHPPTIMRHARADQFSQERYFQEHRLAPLKRELKKLLGRYWMRFC